MHHDILLNVLLPTNRNHAGSLRVEIDGLPVREFPVLGRGSTREKGKVVNPTLSPFVRFGNTPTGEYRSPGIESTSGLSRSSYGPWGAVRLKAVSGDALLAEWLGRSGLLIHGGAPDKFGHLRPTHGCLRLRDGDMRKLIELISGASNNAQAAMCEAVSIRITVRE